LLILGTAGWWFWPRVPIGEPPEVPADIRDPAVKQAVEVARQAVLDQPRSADAWGNLGMTLLAYLYHEPADRCFAQAASLDPGNARWLYYRYSIATWIDPPRALELLQRAAEIGSSEPQEKATLRLQLADHFLEQQRLDDAERMYREELQNLHTQPRAALGLGVLLMARGNPAGAAQYFKMAQGSPHTRHRATTQLAILARQRGDEAAVAALEQKAAAMPPDPDWPNPFLKAVFQKRVGRAVEIQDVAQLEREQRYKEAADVSLARAEQEPDNPRHYVRAGVNLAHAGQYDRAVRVLKQAIPLDRENCVPYFHLAETLHQRAEAEWQRSPDSAEARQWFTEAAEVAEQATKRKPDHADAYLIRGLSLLRIGQAAGAVAALQKGVACRPESFEQQLALGEALLEARQRKEAAIHLENARQLKPGEPHLLELLKRLSPEPSRPGPSPCPPP
jgi:tetratricopeptide (TPR) repeat protein